MGLAVQCRDDRLLIGDRLSVGFQRTLRIPDDGRTYPLPPGLGLLPIHPVGEYADRVPPSWRGPGNYFTALYQREALWISFDGAPWRPHAIKVGAGGINAVSGHGWDATLHHDPQDYVVVPDQLWLDGINADEGLIRQFVAMPLGSGYTIEGQLTGQERTGGIQLIVFAPRAGRFPDEEPPRDVLAPAQAMGLGAGGTIRQKIYPDPYGIDVWDRDNSGTATVHVLNADEYAQVTGRTPPLTPISVETYLERGFPWFELYDEDRGDVAAPDSLKRVKSIDAIDAARSAGGERLNQRSDPRGDD
jgi:hypothetical protein